MKTPYVYYLILLIASLLPLWVAYRYKYRFLHEDSYITLTYAKNLLAGKGFVYNHPPAVLGTTTPLLTLLVVCLSVILPFLELPTIAVFLTAFFWIGIIWVIFLFRKTLGLEDWQATVLGLVIIATGWVNNLGMEAYLFAFLLILTVALLYSGRYLFTGITTGLLFLTRGEGMIIFLIILPLVLFWEWRGREKPGFGFSKPAIRFVAGFLMPVLLWFIYARFTFGRFLPSTLDAKLAQGKTGLWPPFFNDLPEMFSSFGSEFSLNGSPFLNLWYLLLFVGLLYVALKKRKWLLLVLWVGVYVLCYSMLEVPSYQWYQLPILFVLQILVAFGLMAIVKQLMKLRHPRYAGLALSLLLVASALFLLGRNNISTTLDWPYDTRAEHYPVLCDWINKNTEPDDSIAYIEVGYLGFFTNNRIIDLAGLVTPEVIPHIANGDFAWGFLNSKPDYYIYYPAFDWALHDIRADPQFDKQYRQVATLPGKQQPDTIIYQRIEQ